MAYDSASVAIKSLKKVHIYNLIASAAQIYEWDRIETNQNMLSFRHSNQRINVWIKMKSMKITVRIQPMEYVKKDVHISNFMNILKDCNEIIKNENYNHEGQ